MTNQEATREDHVGAQSLQNGSNPLSMDDNRQEFAKGLNLFTKRSHVKSGPVKKFSDTWTGQARLLPGVVRPPPPGSKRMQAIIQAPEAQLLSSKGKIAAFNN